uniref:Uncharacterized protein n=1 Tax=Gossypium raimondii TaxID=29730 RepID=A0A0D2SLC9_GOSRA|nr:hypothetical protein B456_N001800 [Gossypium raimondii]
MVYQSPMSQNSNLASQTSYAEIIKDFPAIVKSVLQNIINNDDFYYYFHIEISSLIGIAEQEKFYQPYQIWIIKKMIGTPQLSSVNEDKEHLSKTMMNVIINLIIIKSKQELTYYHKPIIFSMMMFINYGQMEEGYWYFLMETSRRKEMKNL